MNKSLFLSGIAAVLTLAITGNAAPAYAGCDNDDDHSYPVTPIDADCTDNPHPHMCTFVVNQLKAEIQKLHDSLVTPNLDQIVSFYHPLTITHSNNTFYRGRAAVRNNLYAPLLTAVTSANLDFSTYHFQVASPRAVVAYGAISGTITFKDGSTLAQSGLHQTLTWVCQDGDADRPYLILADHE